MKLKDEEAKKTKEKCYEDARQYIKEYAEQIDSGLDYKQMFDSTLKNNGIIERGSEFLDNKNNVIMTRNESSESKTIKMNYKNSIVFSRDEIGHYSEEFDNSVGVMTHKKHSLWRFKRDDLSASDFVNGLLFLRNKVLGKIHYSKGNAESFKEALTIIRDENLFDICEIVIFNSNYEFVRILNSFTKPIKKLKIKQKRQAKKKSQKKSKRKLQANGRANNRKGNK